MKNSLQTKVIILVIILTAYVSTNQSWASSNVLFIFDASERMSGKFPKHTKLKDLSKIDIATEAFESMLENLPQDLNVGFEAYGHHGDRDCSAIEIINPLLPLDTEDIIDNVQQLEPDQGSTPLAKALQQGGEALSAVKGDKIIVLFSDGKDTCGGDIDEAVSQLKEQGITVNVLAIDVKEDEIAELSGIAAANGGQYYSVNNTEDMEKSLESIKEKIEGKTYETEVFFRDDFVEKSLSRQWQVLNPDTKHMKVEKGSVTFITTANKPQKAQNILRLDMPGSEYDWVFTANFTVSPQSMREVLDLGISNKAESQVILAQLNINTDGNILLKGIKGTRKSTSSFQKKLISYKSRNTREHSDFFKQHIKSITVKLEKIEKEYVVSARLEQMIKNDKAVSSRWVTLQKIKSSPLPNDKFFIKAYSKNINNLRTKNLPGEIALKWIEVGTIVDK